MTTPALIGLGSNLGDRNAHLHRAVAALSATPGVIVHKVSSYHETAPMGGPGGQGSFLNATAAIGTTLEPEVLLDRLHAIEHEAGRLRTIRWGERTLDLDILLFGDCVIATPRLRVPHPRMALRRFVLAPSVEVAPESIDPVTGRTVRDLLANLDRRPSYVAIASTPQLGQATFHDVPDPLALADASRFLGGEGLGLHRRLCEALAGKAVENWITDANTFRAVLGLGSVPRWSHAEALVSSVPTETWLVSHFWFDTLFLFLDSLKTPRPRFPRFREQFLEARSTAPPPTFVVARPVDRERFGIQDPRFAWHRPIGWDTPVLEVDDFDSEATLDEVLATCAATRGR
jgi:2-amino-4-hydroxy-6-hydroxymethyldihydropteridine diphosphokinase